MIILFIGIFFGGFLGLSIAILFIVNRGDIVNDAVSSNFSQQNMISKL
jgi:hypothetical protein